MMMNQKKKETLNRENLIILCFFKLISEYICKNQSTQQFPHFVVIDRLTTTTTTKSLIIKTFQLHYLYL